eukprot:COSAG06_NODE_474_length_15284_cov_124.295582_12_plen_1831_part_00
MDAPPPLSPMADDDDGDDALNDLLSHAIGEFGDGLQRLRSDASTPAAGAEPSTPRLPVEDELQPEPEAEASGPGDEDEGRRDGLRGSIVLNSEFGYSSSVAADSSPYAADGSAWSHFTVEDSSTMMMEPEPEPEALASLTTQRSGTAVPSRIIYMNAATRPQEHTTTAEKLIGELLRAGTVNEETVTWVPDYEQHLLGDVIDLDAARDADDVEVAEVVHMLSAQLQKLPRSSTRSFPSPSDTTSKPLPPFSVTIYEPGPLGISWTSRTNASPPEIERVAPGSIAARVPQLQRGMVLLSAQGGPLHGLTLSAMLGSIDQHSERPLLLGFAEPATGLSDGEVCTLAAGAVLAPAYRKLRARASHEVEIFRHAARELRLEEERRFATAPDPRTATQMTLSQYEDTVTAVRKKIKPGTKLLVKADYKPSFEGAIPVQKDQEVVALDTRHAEWWAVDAGGKRGHVPKTFLEPLRDPFMCMVRLPKPYDHVETGLACNASTTAQKPLDAALRRLMSLLKSGGSAPTEDMRKTMKADTPASIPLEASAYTLKVAGFDDYVADSNTRLVDVPTVRQQMRQHAGDKTWRLALHLVQLPGIELAPASPSSSTVAVALELASFRSSGSTPVELSEGAGELDEIPSWWRDTTDISSTLSVNVRAVLGIQPGEQATFEPSVNFEDSFWGSQLVSNVPIGDLYVECVIHCGNRVIGSPHTRTQSRGATVEKRKKPSGTSADPRYVFEEDLDTNARVLELPRKARLIFKVRSARSKQNSVLGSTVAWGALPLFDHRGRLTSGTRELCLWPVGLHNPAMPERGEWLYSKRDGALSAAQNLHHTNPIVLVVHVNPPPSPPLNSGDASASGAASPRSPPERVAGSEPIYHGDVFRKVQLKFHNHGNISFVQSGADGSQGGSLDTTIGDITALASLEPSCSVSAELEAVDAEEAAFRRALEFPVALYQNQTLPLTPEPAAVPSSAHNVGMPTWSDHAGRPIFPVLNIRPTLAETALHEHTEELDFMEIHFDLALRAYLNSFDLTNWLEPTKISQAIEIFIARYCECNPQHWTAWRPMAHRLAMETIRLHANLETISRHDFVSAVGASENGSETELALAKYIRAMYDRITAAGGPLKDDDDAWDENYCVGSYGQDSHDERALHLKSAIELMTNGSQILDVGWEWKADSSWSVDRKQVVDTDEDGWSYAADWQSCWYSSQNDVIWKEAEMNGHTCTQVVRRRRWVRPRVDHPIADVGLAEEVVENLREAMGLSSARLARVSSRWQPEPLPDEERGIAGPAADHGWRSLQDFSTFRAVLKSDAMWEPLDAQQSDVVFYYRQRLRQLPEMTPKLLLCVDWQQPRQVERALRCLSEHAPVPWHVALQLLDARYPHASVRLYAVHSLRSVTDEHLMDFLLQLVQTLKYEANHDNPVTRFLLSRALRCPGHIGHRLFWTLRSELHDPMLMERFGLILEEYLKGLRPADFARIGRESKMLSTLIGLASRVKAHDRRKTEDAAARQTEFLREELTRIGAAPADAGLPATFTLPLDSSFESCGLIPEKCKVMGSAQRPLWLEFKNADPHGSPLAVILKTGDDLRQDILTLQMLKLIDQIWKAEGLNLWLVPYRCVATGEEQGMLEVVPGKTLLQIMREGSGTTSRGFITSTTWLSNWLRAQNPSPAEYEEAKERFLLSNAGYCVVQHVLGIGDRHPSNIMVKPNGNLFHIDFGHFLGHFKYAVKSIGMLRETALPFTEAHVDVLGGRESVGFVKFVETCCEAFCVLRRHRDLFIGLFAMMLGTGIPELQTQKDIAYLNESLMPDASEAEAKQFFRERIFDALENFRDRVNLDLAHALKH